jgi:hypothetical protein
MVGQQPVHHDSLTMIEDLWICIETAWREIPQENIQVLLDSMAHSLEAFTAVHDGFTTHSHRPCIVLYYYVPLFQLNVSILVLHFSQTVMCVGDLLFR